MFSVHMPNLTHCLLVWMKGERVCVVGPETAVLWLWTWSTTDGR